MKSYVRIAIAVSMFAPAAAFAEGSALSSLVRAAGAESAAAVVAPAVSPAAAPVTKSNTPEIVDLADNGATELAASYRVMGAAVFELDGKKMTNKKDLLSYTAKTLGLPDDMDNWDAMVDYLGDLPSTVNNNSVLVVIRNAEAIRSANPKLYSDLRDVVVYSSKNATEWSRDSAHIKFVFVM